MKGGKRRRGDKRKKWSGEGSRWKRRRGGEDLSISVLLLCLYRNDCS